MFFLLDSAVAPAVRYEPCLTGGMAVGGTRSSIARRVLEALPREHPGPWIVLGFPIHEDGSGILQQEKTGMEPVAQTSF